MLHVHDALNSITLHTSHAINPLVECIYYLINIGLYALFILNPISYKHCNPVKYKLSVFLNIIILNVWYLHLINTFTHKHNKNGTNGKIMITVTLKFY